MIHRLFAPLISKLLVGGLALAVTAAGVVQLTAHNDAPAEMTLQTQGPVSPISIPAPPTEVAPAPPQETAPAPAVQVPAAVARADAAVASKKVAAPAPVAQAVQAVQQVAAAACTSGVSDSQIAKLRAQISKVKAERPDLAAGVAKLEQKVSDIADGRVCSADLQATFNSICADPQMLAVINAMVAKMPLLARLAVGDPCKKDLTTLLNMMDQMVPGLNLPVA